MLISTLTSKGQITVPIDVRAALGLESGDKVVFEALEPGRFAFSVVKPQPISTLKGMLGRANRRVSVEEMNEAIRRRGSTQPK
jgi:antitoxin PrlF